MSNKFIYFIVLTFCCLLGNGQIKAQSGVGVLNFNEISCPECDCEDEEEGSTLTIDDETSDGVKIKTTDLSGESVNADVQSGDASSLIDAMSDGLEGDAAVFGAEEVGLLVDMFATVNDLAAPYFVLDFIYDLYEASGENLSAFTCYIQTMGLGILSSGIEERCIAGLNSELKLLGIKHYWEELNVEINNFIDDVFHDHQTSWDFYASSYIPGQFPAEISDLSGEANRFSAVLTNFPSKMDEDFLRNYLAAAGQDAHVDQAKWINRTSGTLTTADQNYSRLMYSNEFALSELSYYTDRNNQINSVASFHYEVPDINLSKGSNATHPLQASFTQSFDYNADVYGTHKWSWESLEGMFISGYKDQYTQDKDIKLSWSIDRTNVPIIFALARMNASNELEIIEELPYTATDNQQDGFMITINDYEITQTNKKGLFIVSYLEAYDASTFLVDDFRGILSSGTEYSYFGFLTDLYEQGYTSYPWDSDFQHFLNTYYPGHSGLPFPGGVGKTWDTNQVTIENVSWSTDEFTLDSYTNKDYLKYLIEEPQLTKRILMISPFRDFIDRTSYMEMAGHYWNGNKNTTEPGWVPKIITHSSFANLDDPEIGNVHLEVQIPMEAFDALKIQNLATPDQMISVDLADGPASNIGYPGYYAKAELIKTDDVSGQLSASDLKTYWVYYGSQLGPLSDQTAVHPDVNTQYETIIIENVSNYVTGDVIMGTYLDNFGNIVTSPAVVTLSTELKRDYYSFAKQDGVAGISGNYLEVQTDGTVLLTNNAPASGAWLADPMDGGYILMDRTTGKALTSTDGSSVELADYYRDDAFIWIPDYEADDDLVFYNLGWGAYLSVDDNNTLVLDADEFLELEILPDDLSDPADILEFDADTWLLSRAARALVEEDLSLKRFTKDQDLSHFEANYTIEYYGAEQYSIRNNDYEYLTVVEDGNVVYNDWLSYYGTLGVGFQVEEYAEFADQDNYITIKSVANSYFLKVDDYSDAASLTFDKSPNNVPSSWQYHFDLVEDTEVAPDIFVDRAYYNITSPHLELLGRHYWYTGPVLIDPLDDGTVLLMNKDGWGVAYPNTVLIAESHTYNVSEYNSTYDIGHGFAHTGVVDLSSTSQAWKVYKDRDKIVLMSAAYLTYAEISIEVGLPHYLSLNFVSSNGSLFDYEFQEAAPPILFSGEYVFVNEEYLHPLHVSTDNSIVISTELGSATKFNVQYVGALRYDTDFMVAATGDGLILDTQSSSDDLWYIEEYDGSVAGISKGVLKHTLKNQKNNKYLTAPNDAGPDDEAVASVSSTAITHDTDIWMVLSEMHTNSLRWLTPKYENTVVDGVAPFVWNWNYCNGDNIYCKTAIAEWIEGISYTGDFPESLVGTGSGTFTIEAETYLSIDAGKGDAYEFFINQGNNTDDFYDLYIIDGMGNSYLVSSKPEGENEWNDAIYLHPGYYGIKLIYGNKNAVPVYNGKPGVEIRAERGRYPDYIMDPISGYVLMGNNDNWGSVSDYVVMANQANTNGYRAGGLYGWTYTSNVLTEARLYETSSPDLEVSVAAGQKVELNGLVDFGLDAIDAMRMAVAYGNNPTATVQVYLDGQLVLDHFSNPSPGTGYMNVSPGVHSIKLIIESEVSDNFRFVFNVGIEDINVYSKLVPTYYYKEVDLPFINVTDVRLRPTTKRPEVAGNVVYYEPLKVYGNVEEWDIIMNPDYTSFAIKDASGNSFLAYHNNSYHLYPYGSNANANFDFVIEPSDTYSSDHSFLFNLGNNHMNILPDGTGMIGSASYNAFNDGNPFIQLLSFQEDIELYAEADTYLRGGPAAAGACCRFNNYGGDGTVIVKNTDNSSKYYRAPLMKFDLSDFGQISTNAELKLIPDYITNDAMTRVFKLMYAHDNWTEMVVTTDSYMNNPGTNSSDDNLIHDYLTGANASTVNLRVSSIDQERRHDGIASFIIESTLSGGNAYIKWKTKEYGDGSDAPKLILDAWVPMNYIPDEYLNSSLPGRLDDSQGEEEETDLAETLTDQEESNSLVVYPNPANDEVTIDFKLEADSPVTITWLDVTGRKVLTSTFSAAPGSQSVSFDNLSASGIQMGVYLLKIVSKEFTKEVRLIIEE